jgi:hypothetical protein
MVILTPIENESLQVFLEATHKDLRGYLNQILPQNWIGLRGQEDDALMRWPLRFPDLIPCDFLFWRFVNDTVFVPQLPDNLKDLRNRITAAVALVNRYTLTRVWDEMDYRIDVHRISKGGQICELRKKYLVSLSLFQCDKIWYLLRSLFIVNFQIVSRTCE